MTVATRLRQYLESEGVSYNVVPHPRTATSVGSAHSAHVPGDKVAKPVVVHHELGYLLAVVPSTHRVELSTLQGVLDQHLSLATEDELGRLFDDCELGAIPPIGAAYGVPVVLDETVCGATEVFFEGGDHKSLVQVSGEAFQKLTKEARRARFSHPA